MRRQHQGFLLIAWSYCSRLHQSSQKKNCYQRKEQAMEAFLDLPRALDRTATLEELREAGAVLECTPAAPNFGRAQKARFPLDLALIEESVEIGRLWLDGAGTDSRAGVLGDEAEAFAEFLAGRRDLLN
jgi:hypothetical protein